MNLQRIRGSFKRQMYATYHSPHRIFELFFWPVMDILLWGFITVYLQQTSARLAVPVGFFLGAALLWDIIFRGKVSVGTSFLEETWTRNVLNVMATPIKPSEYFLGALVVAIIRLGIGWVVIAVISWLAFAFSVTELGVALLPFVANVFVTGVVLGLFVLALLIRFGQGIEVLTWGLAFLAMPISAVFFPVSSLPGWLQPIAWSWPASHVFEGMRAVLAGAPIPWNHVWIAAVLNVVYLGIGFGFVSWALATLRRRGFVTRYL